MTDEVSRRLEERLNCLDDEGNLYRIEVYRQITRRDDGSQVPGLREAFIAGDPARPVKVFDDEDAFQTRGGKILRRVKS